MKNVAMQNVRTKILDLLSEAEKNYNLSIDYGYYLPEDLAEICDADQFRDYLIEENVCSEDVIYYSVAIDYLREHDQSLRESLEIAGEFGFTPENLNSEVLASLLKTRNNEIELSELFNDIEQDFNDLLEEYENIKNFVEDWEDSDKILEIKLDNGKTEKFDILYDEGNELLWLDDVSIDIEYSEDLDYHLERLLDEYNDYISDQE